MSGIHARRGARRLRSCACRLCPQPDPSGGSRANIQNARGIGSTDGIAGREPETVEAVYDRLGRSQSAPTIDPRGRRSMKYLDEYRDQAVAQKLVKEVRKTVTQPWVLMEICGGQTHSIVKYGIDERLPKELELVHGPGCPVCVTSLEMIDKAHRIAERPDVVFCSFGDMLRVPGSEVDLLIVKSRGADIRIVYSPLDCLKIARANPHKKVVFFGIGFETTAPANAMAVWQAKREGIRNFSLLVSHVLVPPVMTAILQSHRNRVQGFLGPGHVCAVMGYKEYEPISARYRVPIVITGFEPADLLDGILKTVQQLEAGRAEVQNQYSRVITRQGNTGAQQLINKVFDV